MSAAIEVAGLRKSFRRLRGGRTTAVDGLDFTVPKGSVYGFLGPNGSGKTTTIRCLLGLVSPDAGDVSVLGERRVASVMDRVGSIVETPTFFAGFSGRRNLEILSGLAGLSTERLDASLDEVGLTERAGDRVRTYSLGMKQRLGLAAVLMKDPELLILDEPANGLDPAGIRDTRDTLRSVASSGKTVFVSSHILSEVQAICDQVAILSRGRCLAQGTVAEVLSGGRTHTFVVRVANLRRARTVLSQAGFVAKMGGDKTLRVAADVRDGAAITEALAGEGLFVSELRSDDVTLESVFLDLTGDEVT